LSSRIDNRDTNLDAKTQFNLRLSIQELERWRNCMPSSSLSGWLRQLANEECDRLEAVEADTGQQKAERLKMMQTVAPGVTRAADLYDADVVTAARKKSYTPDFK
jgi:hypothetical protein